MLGVLVVTISRPTRVGRGKEGGQHYHCHAIIVRSVVLVSGCGKEHQEWM